MKTEQETLSIAHEAVMKLLLGGFVVRFLVVSIRTTLRSSSKDFLTGRDRLKEIGIKRREKSTI